MAPAPNGKDYVIASAPYKIHALDTILQSVFRLGDDVCGGILKTVVVADVDAIDLLESTIGANSVQQQIIQLNTKHKSKSAEPA